MKPRKIILIAILCLISFGCQNPDHTPPANNAAARTGQDLQVALSEVMQDYADVKAGGVNSLWSISKGMNALGIYTRTKEDVLQLIKDWKSTQGDSLVVRLSKVLNHADVPPTVQAAAVAKAAESVAKNTSP